MSISDHIKNLYVEYTATSVRMPTPKQLNLIKFLGGDPDQSTTHSEATKQIRFLIGTQTLNPYQKYMVSQLPPNQINHILKRDVDLDQMTVFEYDRVTQVLSNLDEFSPNIYHHPIYSEVEYEYGWQEAKTFPDGKMYYIVFYNLLMIDIDHPDVNLDSLKSQIIELGLSGRLYKTYNGYHLFITSKSIPHRSSEAKSIMKHLDCDIYYIAFAHATGFKVRLNPKDRLDEMVAATFVNTIGVEPEIPDLINLLEIHDKKIKLHQKHGCSIP